MYTHFQYIVQIISHISSALSIVYKSNSWLWKSHKLAEVAQSYFFHTLDSIRRMGQKFHGQRKELVYSWGAIIHIKQESAPQRLKQHPRWEEFKSQRSCLVCFTLCKEEIQKTTEFMEVFGVEHLSCFSHMLCWVL